MPFDAPVIIQKSSVPALVPDLSTIGQQAAEFARLSKSPATLRAYQSDFADFEGWCLSLDLCPMPALPTTVGAYLGDRATKLKVASLRRRVAAITAIHRLSGHGFDSGHIAVSSVMSGIARALGRPQEGKEPLLDDELVRIVKLLPPTMAGARDRALLLVGFATASRRSELVGFNFNDVKIGRDGAEFLVRRSKTDQEGVGAEKGVPRSKRACPVAALEQWLRLSGITEGPIFREVRGNWVGAPLSGNAVAEVVKRSVKLIGLDPGRYGAHSLRSGFATSAARAGSDLAHIMLQTLHKNADVARRYVRKGNLLKNPASKAVKL